MRLKLLLFTLLCTLATLLPARAETLTVYDGTVTSDKVPAYISYWDDFTRSEFVIPASALEDMVGGTISAIKFYSNSNNVPYTSASTADVYLKEVSYTSISSFETKANSTIVYQGTVSVVSANGGGEMTITFTTPFTYNGGNLLIGTENTTDAGYKFIYFYGQTVNGASVAGYDSSSAASAPATQRNFIPKTTFTYEPASTTPKPTDLAVSDITARTASASWTGNDDAQSYNLRYRKVLGYSQTFFESFETFPGSWTIIDSDGDGNNWTQFNPQNFSNSPFDAYDGSYGAISRSWQGDALTPDNWLISPQVNLGGMLKYYIVDDGKYQETYRIYVSTTGTNIADFQPLTNDLQSPASTTWTERTHDLSAYEGQQGYIAFRQYNCTDQDFMIIDAVSIEAMTYGDWVEVDNVTSPYTITSLEAETDYVVQVQSVYDEGNSNWTNQVLFTTASADAIPIDLAVNNVTWDTGDATWNGSQDSYNLRYRPYVNPVNKNRFWDLNTSDQLEGWYIIDANNDTYNWQWLGFGDEGDRAFFSASYVNNVGSITPNNWLITPEVKLGGTLKLNAWGYDSSDFAEVFGVYVGPATFSTNLADYTQIDADITVTHDKTEYVFDLSAYEGTGRLAIVHHNCSNQFYLVVDDITVIVPDAQDDYPWQTVNGVTSPYTIAGLDPETDYEVQVQGVVDNETNTGWTASAFFTTLAKPAEMTLAQLCTSGVDGTEYIISNENGLRGVYQKGTSIWFKDENGEAVDKQTPGAGDKFYVVDEGNNVTTSEADFDQSNWIEVVFPEEASYTDAYVKNLAGTFTNVNGNPKLVITHAVSDNDVTTITDPSDEYTPNPYIAANFEGSQQGYFFSTPKAQEYAKILWAVWNGTQMTMQTNAFNFTGSFTIDPALNFKDFSSLQEGKAYDFLAIICKNAGSKAPGDTYKVYPLNLDGDVPTAINDIASDSYRGNIVGVDYVNSIGQRNSKPFQGVNIVVTRYSDGSTTSVKKIFK